MTNYNEYLRLYLMLTGRRVYALQGVHEQAQSLGDDVLVARTAEALAHDRETLRLERQWAARAQPTSERKQAMALDGQVDRLISGVHRTALTKRDNLPASDPEAVVAAEFVQRFFPNGAAAYTALPMEDEAAEVDWLLGALHEDEARTRPIEAVATLGVGAYVRQLVALLPAYHSEIGVDAQGALRYATVRKAQIEGQERLARIVARILGTYDTPDQDAARASLLAPVAQQQSRIAAYIKRRRRVPDANPVTGDESPVSDTETPADT